MRGICQVSQGLGIRNTSNVCHFTCSKVGRELFDWFRYNMHMCFRRDMLHQIESHNTWLWLKLNFGLALPSTSDFVDGAWLCLCGYLYFPWFCCVELNCFRCSSFVLALGWLLQVLFVYILPLQFLRFRLLQGFLHCGCACYCCEGATKAMYFENLKAGGGVLGAPASAPHIMENHCCFALFLDNFYDDGELYQHQ